jgi:hypothetical protein
MLCCALKPHSLSINACCDICLMEDERDQKGNLVMIRKIVLVLIMGVTLAGAAATSTPVPVLLAMGCLILWALSVALRRQQQE